MLISETFHGYIETTQDALLIFESCRRGLLPKICRRLQERERKMIRSGSIFVFDERESGKEVIVSWDSLFLKQHKIKVLNDGPMVEYGAHHVFLAIFLFTVKWTRKRMVTSKGTRSRSDS
jgi:hypothetical protein